MGKKIVKLTEEKFKEIVTESVNKVLNEIGYRGAALAHGANYNAQQDYFQNNNVNSRNKMAKSEIISLKALSLAINDNFPNFLLEFVEKNKATNRAYRKGD
jgi:endo-alpha-1,4-polygalactosaminidase (GH114 family)